MRLLLVTLTLLSICSSISVARTWYIKPDVTGDAPTIQAAIDSASAGDTVLLAPGLFRGGGNRNIDFKGKAITVTSEFGPYTSQIVLPDDDSVGFIFKSGEGPSSRLEGVGIVGGGRFEISLFATGIKCVSSSPTIVGNHIVSMNHGTAIKCDNSSATISSNIIEWMVRGRKGSGIAISCTGGSPVIVGNIVRENGTAGSIVSTIDGIVCGGGSPTIQGNEIVDNVAVRGISVSDCLAEVSDNIVGGTGLGISALGSTPSTIVNNTIVENSTNVTCSSPSVITGNIIAFGSFAFKCQGGIPTVSCNVIFGHTESDSICGIDGGGNIAEDPLFCGPPDPAVYTLHVGSPCLPENNTCGKLIGALPPGCGGGAAVECPADVVVPSNPNIPYLVLEGFTIRNIHASPLSFAYAVHSAGPGTLVDNGDPASVAGVTPPIEPGGSYTTPQPGLEIPSIRVSLQQRVTHEAEDPVISATVACAHSIFFWPPVPVFITNFSATAREAAVDLAWDVVSDENMNGFNIYRSLKGTDTRSRVNLDGLIPPSERNHVDETVVAGGTYSYTLGVVQADGSETISRTATVTMTAHRVALHQNFPNPFNPSTTIRYWIAKQGPVTLTVYNVAGKHVRTLVKAVQRPAATGHIVRWDGRNESGEYVSSGVYFYRLVTRDFTQTRKLVLLR
ncbi:MAG: T9SS type A sorting domain-containing protein [Candidatus Krumholzibacteriia bacterium]